MHNRKENFKFRNFLKSFKCMPHEKYQLSASLQALKFAKQVQVQSESFNWYWFILVNLFDEHRAY